MAVKVLITREFKAGKANEALRLLMELRSKVTLRPGYISGQTLIGADTPNRLVVVSTWSDRKKWEKWYADPERKEFSKKMEDLLQAAENVEVFYPGERSAD